jgi:hypothetical protein
MSTEVTTPEFDPTHLPDDPGILKQMVAELLGTVAALRTTIDKQQAHIQYLVRLSFGGAWGGVSRHCKALSFQDRCSLSW